MIIYRDSQSYIYNIIHKIFIKGLALLCYLFQASISSIQALIRTVLVLIMPKKPASI